MQLKLTLKRLLHNPLISGGMWAVAGKIAIAAAALGINALLARLLSPSEMGVYFLIMTLTVALALAAQFGLNHVVVKLVASAMGSGDAGAARAAIVTVARYGAAGALLAGMLVAFAPGRWLAISVFQSPQMAGLLSLIALMIVFTSLQNLLAEGLRGYHDIARATIVGGLLTSICFVAALIAARALNEHAQLDTVLWFYIAALALSVVMGSAWVARKLGPPQKGRSVAGRKLFALVGPIFLINVANFILLQADIWILGMYRPASEVAVYGAAARLASTVLMITSLSYAVLPPYIAAKYARNEIAGLQSLLIAAATATTLIALPWIVTLVIFPGELLGLIYGDYYRSGKIILVLLSLGLLSNVVTGMRGYVLLMTGHERTLLVVSFSSGLINIFLCVLAARYSNATGVALAAMTAMIINSTAELLVVKWRLGIWTFFSIRGIETIRSYLVRHMRKKGSK